MLFFVLPSAQAHAQTLSALESKFYFEYLIKFKSMSYLHVQWLTANEIGELG